MSVDRRRQMIEVNHSKLSLARQCELASIARSSYYYRPKNESEFNLELMRLIDEQYLKTPWYGSRQMSRRLRRQGFRVNRKRIRRLMRKMDLVAVAPAPDTSRRHPRHAVYPYLLRDLNITKPNQVWCADVELHPDGAWLFISGGHHGLELATGIVVAAIEHHGRRFLC